MNMSKVRCCYCKQPRDFSADLHGCEQSRRAMANLNRVIGDIKASQERPGGRELSSEGMRHREDRRHEMASALNVMERPVRPEYQQNGIE